MSTIPWQDIQWFLFLGTFGLTGVQMAILGAGALGAGATVYGANKQSKSVSAANDANLKAQAEQNKNAWANYLMTRGLNPAGAQTGTIPTNPQAINARLPLWANANFRTPGAIAGQGATWRKKGQAAQPNMLAR